MGFRVAGKVLAKAEAVEEVWRLLLPSPGSSVDLHAEDEVAQQQLPEIGASIRTLLEPIKDQLGVVLQTEFSNGTLRLTVTTVAAHPSADSPPLRIDKNGDYRVGNSNVLLSTIVREFEEGASPEYIAHAYDTLRLADVYVVLGWYMNHKELAQSYLERREQQGAELRREIEAHQPARPGFRSELLARRAKMEQRHAAPAD